MQLPDLSGLRLSNTPVAPTPVAPTDVELLDLPDELLARTIAGGDGARTLCDQVDRLQRTGNRTRQNRDLWRAIAGQWRMPDAPPLYTRPAQNATARAWREFVQKWCEAIRPGSDENGYALTRLASDQCVWLGYGGAYAWIHSMVTIPLSWIKQDLFTVARQHDDIRFFETTYDRFARFPNHQTGKVDHLRMAMEGVHPGTTLWLLTRLLSEASEARWPPSSNLNTDALLNAKREELKDIIKMAAYTSINEFNYIVLVPVLESIIPPNANHMHVMLVQASHESDYPIPFMSFLDERYRYTTATDNRLSTLQAVILDDLGALPEEENAFTEVLALLREWMAR